MKIKSFFKDEKGAVLPLVTIILGLFGLGFTALVVDVGILYVERKAMITSADASALAGAQVLKEYEVANLSDSDAKIQAEKTAREYAVENGADSNMVYASAEKTEVTLPSGAVDNRWVVDVTVGENKKLLFARFLGDDNTDIKAHAVATWGYVYKSYIGLFPLFVFDITAETNGKLETGTNAFLHEKYDGSNNSYGLISLDSGKNAIKAAIAGESSGGTYIDYGVIDGKPDQPIAYGEPGQATSIGQSVEARMRLAQSKDSAQARKETMIVLVPVIDHVAFTNPELNPDLGNAQNYKLPIKYFAYFEIKDLIKKNNYVGSDEALDPSNEYKKVGSPINYRENPSGAPFFSAGEKAESSIIYGQFTGVTVNTDVARVITEVGDQTNPDNGGNAPATYVKLIK